MKKHFTLFRIIYSPLQQFFGKAILCSALVSGWITSDVQAQMVNYKILKDDPKDVVNLWVYLDVAQMDFAIKNIDGSSFNLGLWTTGTFKEKLGGDFIFRRAWITFGKLGGSGTGDKLRNHLQLEVGGFYQIGQSSKTSNTNVILSQSTSYNSQGQQVTTTRSIKIPASKVSSFGVRGGFLTMGGVYGMDKIESTAFNFPDRINYNMAGIYAGILSTGTRSVIINTDTDGKAAKMKRVRFYADALLLPVTSAKLGGADYKNMIDPGVFGFRVGVLTLPTELRKVKSVDVKSNGFSFGFELGMRPFDGFYFTGNWSFCLARKKLKALGYVTPESERNTSE